MSVPRAETETPSEGRVTLQDVAVTFRREGRALRALRGVSLAIREREVVAIVGESGSGKSVLGLSILGLLPTEPAPEVSGSVLVHGVDMLTADLDARRAVRRRHLGAVFQDPMTSLNPTMRVGQQVVEAADTVDEAVEMLRLVGVPDPRRRLGAYPHELSGGLRQRVMLAMAMAGVPELVIADEPTTALDVTVQAQILALIGDLRERLGTSFVLVTHDIGVAAQVADRIVVLYGGLIVETGPTAELLASPSHPYTASLLRSRITLASPRWRPVVSLGGEPPDPRAHPPGCPFAPRCPLASEECDASMPPLATAVSHDGLSACYHQESVGQMRAAQAPQWRHPVHIMSGERVLTATGLVKQYPVREGLGKRKELHALRGVDLQLRRGECLALVGESGSGKSTVLRVLAGLEEASGERTAYARGEVQMVFQDAGASLTPWLTVGELLEDRLRRTVGDRGERRRLVAEALRNVGLNPDVARARAMELSGGQRQRVVLARATIVPPKVLLCDEPTSALDASLAATVLNLLGELRRELQMAVVFVTHDLAVARLVADRIAVMYLGEIVEAGPAADVVAGPRHPYTQSLIHAVPDLGTELVRLPGEPPSPLDVPAGCAFRPRCFAAVDACERLETALWTVDEASGHCAACLHVRDRRPAPADVGEGPPHGHG
jgi:peptide/nickel transport system ATP-binding protein